MKKRTALIGGILSLLPLGQQLLIKTGFVLSSVGIVLSVPEKAIAKGAQYYFNRAYNDLINGDYSGAISDFNEVLELDPKFSRAY